MASENVELVERLYSELEWLFTDESAEAAKYGVTDDSVIAIDAYRHIRTLLEYLADDVVWKAAHMPEPVTGHAEVIHTIEPWMEAMAGWRVVDQSFSEVSDDAVLGEIRGPDRRLYALFTIAGGKVTRYWEYPDRDEALASVGASS
jgi:ketosteroid isomerase-like protein